MGHLGIARKGMYIGRPKGVLGQICEQKKFFINWPTIFRVAPEMRVISDPHSRAGLFNEIHHFHISRSAIEQMRVEIDLEIKNVLQKQLKIVDIAKNKYFTAVADIAHL